MPNAVLLSRGAAEKALNPRKKCRIGVRHACHVVCADCREEGHGFQALALLCTAHPPRAMSGINESTQQLIGGTNPNPKRLHSEVYANLKP